MKHITLIYLSRILWYVCFDNLAWDLVFKLFKMECIRLDLEPYATYSLLLDCNTVYNGIKYE